ncbi:MAG: TolC family protein, partial [Muribaculaceae bacterium]|nr:TolC family protein [Muribaculaceae bacterium]
MNNHRLLTGLVAISLLSATVRAYGQNERIVSLEEIFETAEANSVRLRPSFTAEEEARQEISVAKSQLLPDIEANLSLSYIGDGFTTKRNFSDSQKAPIPHFGNGLGINITQPVYTGGALTTGIKMTELKSTAARYATELQRDNMRFSLTGFYLDIYKYSNLRRVVENNLAQARKVLAEMQARYEQGVVLRNDITRYELLISNLELQLVKIDNTLNILNHNLVVTAGMDENTRVLPDTTILNRSLPSYGKSQWQRDAYDNSPALKLARSGVDMSRKAEDLVKSERLPKVGLQAAWTIDGPILVEVPPINRNLSYWYVGVGVSYNLASLYKSNKALAKSRTATQKSIEQLEATREDIDLAVNADYVKYLEA